jgi:outer membrane cobalamin receptor
VVSELVVTASRANLLGAAVAASQGSVTRKEVELRPVFRIGQVFETVPGLVVTVHSGEGKANQYLLRGYNLDHGTDFASFIDGMPVNRSTNAHGQGYSDQNFVMAQVVEGLDYTKGPYYAAIGDFAAVGSASLQLENDLPEKLLVSAGTLGDEDIFAAATHHFDDDDRAWAAVELGHLDGPWSPPNDFRKLNAAVRFSHGDSRDGFSLTGFYYKSQGQLTTDQPLRALREGLIGPFGTLDPTDGSQSVRWSVFGAYARQGMDWSFSSNAYFIHSTMTLWNDFTHFLEDPVNGDQEEQPAKRA